uniref:Uncharacterized protein n=1 Tax=Ditylenchus dipsaci TaxID=166011 RepID=A0A915EF41_9BILA
MSLQLIEEPNKRGNQINYKKAASFDGDDAEDELQLWKQAKETIGLMENEECRSPQNNLFVMPSSSARDKNTAAVMVMKKQGQTTYPRHAIAEPLGNREKRTSKSRIE